MICSSYGNVLVVGSMTVLEIFSVTFVVAD